MKVFEDLIEELRDENLLEETVIDIPKSSAEGPNHSLAASSESGGGSVEPGFALEEQEPQNERDFYRKRAMDEVSSLQMVEHILSGIEREHMKMVPGSYDDLEAKKALHRFLQVQGDTTTSEYAEAEFALMRETEAWNTALSARDGKISASNLRRFCENSRPVLSSQALMALGRFYRNAAYTELTRSKFDLVMTRLFSRETEEERRRLLFSRVDMIGHLKTLYANWASVALYSTEESSMKTRAVVAGFDDRVAEAENAETFQQLIQNSFFDKVHEFKEATGEMFFTPEVVAATIDCNVRIGNKFVDLIQLERERTTTDSVEQKYGFEYDQIISDAAGKTLHLVELLKSLPDPESAPDVQTEKKIKKESRPKAEKTASAFSDMFRVNKWLLMATILVVVVSGALFFWANQPTADSTAAESAKDVNLDGTELKGYMRSGRASSETFYAITLPEWDQATEDKKKEILAQALELAKKNGQRNVQLLNVRGRDVGVASDTRIQIIDSNP